MFIYSFYKEPDDVNIFYEKLRSFKHIVFYLSDFYIDLLGVVVKYVVVQFSR